MPISLLTRLNRVIELQQLMTQRSNDNVAKAAASLAQRANALAPRQTGSLAASIYVSGPGNDSTYPEAVGAAMHLNPSANEVLEVTPQSVDPKAGKNHPVAIVAPGVLHGLFIELGTRFMAPEPYLTPAVEAMRVEFPNMMATVADLP